MPREAESSASSGSETSKELDVSAAWSPRCHCMSLV